MYLGQTLATNQHSKDKRVLRSHIHSFPKKNLAVKPYSSKRGLHRPPINLSSPPLLGELSPDWDPITKKERLEKLRALTRGAFIHELNLGNFPGLNGGLSTLLTEKEFNQALTEGIENSARKALSEGGLGELTHEQFDQALGSWFSKAVKKVTKKAKAVVKTVAKPVKKAAAAVRKIAKPVIKAGVKIATAPIKIAQAVAKEIPKLPAAIKEEAQHIIKTKSFAALLTEPARLISKAVVRNVAPASVRDKILTTIDQTALKADRAMTIGAGIAVGASLAAGGAGAAGAVGSSTTATAAGGTGAVAKIAQTAVKMAAASPPAQPITDPTDPYVTNQAYDIAQQTMSQQGFDLNSPEAQDLLRRTIQEQQLNAAKQAGMTPGAGAGWLAIALPAAGILISLIQR